MSRLSIMALFRIKKRSGEQLEKLGLGCGSVVEPLPNKPEPWVPSQKLRSQPKCQEQAKVDPRHVVH